MYVVAYYIVLAMRNQSTMVNSKKILIFVLLFYIAMNDPTIYLIGPDHVVQSISILILILFTYTCL